MPLSLTLKHRTSPFDVELQNTFNIEPILRPRQTRTFFIKKDSVYANYTEPREKQNSIIFHKLPLFPEQKLPVVAKQADGLQPVDRTLLLYFPECSYLLHKLRHD